MEDEQIGEPLAEALCPGRHGDEERCEGDGEAAAGSAKERGA